MKTLVAGWEHPIDPAGLTIADRMRIGEIGYEAWAKEVSKPKIKVGQRFLTGQPIMDTRSAYCDSSKGGCGHFLTVHTRGLILWDKCLHPGCECKRAVLSVENPLKVGQQFKQQKENKVDEKQVVTAAEVGKLKDVMPELVVTTEVVPNSTTVTVPVTEKKPATLGKKGAALADAFISIAKANGGVVTLQQAKEVNPGAPSDLAYYARIRGAEVTTDKKKGGGTQWTLVKE